MRNSESPPSWLLKLLLFVLLSLLCFPYLAIAEPAPKPERYADLATLTPERPILKDSVLCNCYAYTKQQFPSLPSTRDILGNLSDTGQIAVFYYASIGLNHYAVVIERTDTHITIAETNYHGCQQTWRTVPLDDPALLGFYSV